MCRLTTCLPTIAAQRNTAATVGEGTASLAEEKIALNVETSCETVLGEQPVVGSKVG